MKSNFTTFLLAFLVSISVSAEDGLKVKSFLPSVNDLTARTNIRKDNLGSPCAVVKVIIADKEVAFECGNLASMIVGDVSFHTNEYWVYLAAGPSGAKHLKVKHPDYPTIDVVFADYGFSTLEPQTTYTLVISKIGKISKFKKTSFYIQPFAQIGISNGFGFSLGSYIKNFNIEAYYTFDFGKSEEIFWISSENTGNSSSYSYIYKSFKYGGKVGYGVLLGKRFRLTPQVGVNIVSLKGAEVAKGTIDPNAKNGYAFDMDFAIKADLYITKWLTIGIAPEYSLALSKSNLFERTANVSSKINDFCSGFNVKAMFTFNF